MFAPRIEDDKTVDSYLDLIYRLLISDNNLENIEGDSDNSSFTSDNNDISTAEIALILDPRMKNFLFVNRSKYTQQKSQAKFLLRDLYTQLKQDQAIKNLKETTLTMNPINNTEDIFLRM
ncbi:9050_t:CDS:2 [Dentiscutata erythropus]|uniref:9050_t:CDS:1 n=1 Tax=Dentiscutata erythropus TaxID=1348616 RepID=A0A9N9HZ01_9GLOM|nr:9050_t:CDS:2 [Dentiscutata erythropus]